MIDNSWMLQDSHYNQPTYCQLFCDVSHPPNSEQFPPGLFLQCSIDMFALLPCRVIVRKHHPHQKTFVCVWESNIKLSDLTWCTGYFFFFFVQTITSPLTQIWTCIGSKKWKYSLHKICQAHLFYMAPFQRIFPNFCPNYQNCL